MAKSLNTDKVLEELDKVPLSRLISAIESIKKHYPDKNDNDINISFEYLIGSFFPNILENIKAALNEAHTSGYIEGMQSVKESID